MLLLLLLLMVVVWCPLLCNIMYKSDERKNSRHSCLPQALRRGIAYTVAVMHVQRVAAQPLSHNLLLVRRGLKGRYGKAFVVAEMLWTSVCAGQGGRRGPAGGLLWVPHRSALGRPHHARHRCGSFLCSAYYPISPCGMLQGGSLVGHGIFLVFAWSLPVDFGCPCGSA